MELKFEVYGKIARPVAAVFNAVTDPKELSSILHHRRRKRAIA